MLVKAAKEDIERYMDFAYSLAIDQTKSGYPLWSNSVSTKEEFVERVWKGFRRDDEEILLFVVNGSVEGLIQFFYIEKDRYLQTNGFFINSNTEQALTEFLKYACEHFAGYDLYLGFPKRNTDAITFLQKSDCRLIEQSYHNIFIFDDSVIQVETDGIVRVTESNFSEFSRIYKTDPETYWTSDRIFTTLNEWLIYMLYKEDDVVAYICAKNGEIFSLGYYNNTFNKSAYKALVTVILRDLQAAGCKYMTFFNDKESQSAALQLGFSCVAEYVLYIKSVR